MTETGNPVHFGVKWLGISMGVSRLIRLGTTVVLARVLMREDFGLITLATTTIFALSAFRELGFGQALVHRRDKGGDDEKSAADTVFVISLISNTVLFSAGWIAAPWLAGYFDKLVGLEPILRAMFALFLIEAFSSTASAVLQKRLDFGVISTNEILGTLAYALLAISLALTGIGVWSLVLAQLLSRALQTYLLVRASGWVPGLKIRWRMTRELFSYGKWLWGSAMFQAISRAADKLVIGKMSGGGALGSYGIAFNLCSAPAKPTSSVINRVAFPALARIRDDLPRVSDAYVRAISMIAFVALPAAVGLAAVADDFVVTVYGGKWADMGPLVEVLAFYGMALAVGTIARPLLLALGRPDVVMWVGAGRQVLLLVWLAAFPTPLGIAWAVTGSALCSMSVGLAIGARTSHCAGGRILAPLVRTAGTSLVMGVVVLAARGWVPGWPAPARLGLCVLLGILTYGGGTLLFNRGVLQVSLDNVRQILRSKGRLAA